MRRNPLGMLACSAKPTRVGTLLLALGSNKPGRWGEPHAGLRRALAELDAAGIKILGTSVLYMTPPVGSGRQAAYLNAVIAAKGCIGPASLLRLLKRLERQAGRRSTPPSQPRPLDIDILDFGGRRLNWPARERGRGRLVLPHPLLHKRAFVLVPLLEVAPRWSHPVLGVRARTLLARLGPSGARGIRKLTETPPSNDCAGL